MSIIKLSKQIPDPRVTGRTVHKMEHIIYMLKGKKFDAFTLIRKGTIHHSMEMGNRKTIRLWSKDIFFVWRRSIAKRRPS